MSHPISRRQWLRSSLLGAGALGFPAVVRSQAGRPAVTWGAQTGDIRSDRAIVWSRTDRPSRLIVEYSLDPRMTDLRRRVGPAALESSGFTSRLDLTQLPAGQTIYYRVLFEDLAELGRMSEPVAGSFRTAPDPNGPARAVKFQWSGDMVGQGWGINPDIGGVKIFSTMRERKPDFFVHSGDTIYADNPLQASVTLDDGRVWKNVLTEEKSAVAQTLDQFRGAHAYNLLDANVRGFYSEVPTVAQWDDHEVLNNWFPGRRMDADARYQEKSCDLLAARARRAFLDYMPIRPNPADPEQIFRSFSYGPMLDMFLLDERSYRGPNTQNRQERPGPETEFLGSRQVQWLKSRLLASRAVWKVIASDMPIGLVVGDGPGRYEAFANGNGPALGRELELASLLRFIRDNGIRNTVWITADVHYCAAHHYDPSRAQFTDFEPFWEFVAGPLNAGTFGPGAMDNTFGPEVRFKGIPDGMKQNRSPLDGFQFFGEVALDPSTLAMTVSLHNSEGRRLYGIELPPAAGS